MKIQKRREFLKTIALSTSTLFAGSCLEKFQIYLKLLGKYTSNR